MQVEAEVRHNLQLVDRFPLEYAGRTNVFHGDFTVPAVGKDYEVLEVRVTAAQANAANFGFQRRTYKLTP